MRKAVESILGYVIPAKLEFVLQRGIVMGYSAEQIAGYIRDMNK